MNKKIYSLLTLLLAALGAVAQESTTLSPYSQFGVGQLADQSLGGSRGMAGLAYGMRSGRHINMTNPASYAAVDSLTMLFDVGLSGRISNMKEGERKVNAHTGNFEYAVASFRLRRHIGLALGMVPYSSIGYDYSVENKQTSTTETYGGDGGFSQLFLGAGWEVGGGWSVGANLSYFWGKYDKAVYVSNSDASVNTMLRAYTTKVTSYKLDLGLQYQRQLNAKNLLTAGLTVGVGHKLNATASAETTTTNPQTGISTTPAPDLMEDAFSLPWTVGVGGTLLRGGSLLVGADYQLQRWGALDYPVYSSSGYTMSGNYYRDRHKVTLGADWQPNPRGRRYYQLIHYRAGFSYATPYYKINGGDGPSELMLSAGFGLPVSRSMVHLSAQWVRSAATGYITENQFRVNLGLTFNERWFAKWKVD